MKRSFSVVGLLVAVMAVAASVAALGSEKQKAREPVHVAQASVQWAQPFGARGPSFGFVQATFGRLGAPASMFIKFPAGGDSGWHDHDGDYEGVVLKGTFTEQQSGEANETLLPTGSYFTQPGKQAHRNGCTKDADCFLYVHFANGATSHPTTPEGKRLPPPKPAEHASRN
jgi:quercetin dioxygenase-like cupin family protein